METNVRETSLLAFEQIKREGILGAVQFRVYELLFTRGPMTAREITWHFEVNEGSNAITTYQPRLRELEGLRAVRRVGERPCRVTGRLAYQWDVTNHVPTADDRRLRGLRKTQPFLLDKARSARLKDECIALFNKGAVSEDFYALILFLEEQTG
jgi:hypothetical protein